MCIFLFKNTFEFTVSEALLTLLVNIKCSGHSRLCLIWFLQMHFIQQQQYQIAAQCGGQGHRGQIWSLANNSVLNSNSNFWKKCCSRIVQQYLRALQMVSNGKFIWNLSVHFRGVLLLTRTDRNYSRHKWMDLRAMTWDLYSVIVMKLMT